MVMDLFDRILRTNVIYYFIFFMIITILYILILKKQLFSIFDPLAFAILEASGAFVTVVVLKQNNLISIKLFYSFILSEISFCIGLFVIKRRNLNVSLEVKDEYEYADKRNILFFLASILYISFQIYLYINNGIPLFRDSASISLLTFDAEGGRFKKVLNALLPILIICICDFFIREKIRTIVLKFIYITMFIFILITLVLSGWKSNFLIIIFIFSIYLFFIYGEKNKYNINLKKINKMNKILLILLIISIISALSIINYNYIHSSKETPLYYLLKRFFLSGDIFIYSYTNPSIFDVLHKGNFFCSMIAYTFIGKFINFYFPSLISTDIGVQVYQNATGNMFLSGPNPRHNFIGLIYFGFYGSIIYSFIIGLMTSFVRKYTYENCNRKLFSNIISCSIFYYITYSQIDLQSLCLVKIYYFIIVILILFIPTQIIYNVCTKNHFLNKYNL